MLTTVLNSPYELTVQIRNNSVILYDKYVGPGSTSGYNMKRAVNMKEQRQKAYSGSLSSGARKRLRKAINLFCQATPTKFVSNPYTGARYPFRFGFLTLTIADTAKNHTAAETYKACLEPLIQWLRRTLKIKMYVWVAELQKRGQIHYHMLLPDFVPWQEIRNKWNYYQLRAGYLDGFREKYGHSDPNSIDIHATKKIKNAEQYLSKYLTKGGNVDVPQSGKVWDCSDNLKNAKFFEHTYSNEIARRCWELWEARKLQRVDTDHCIIFRMIGEKGKSILPLEVLMQYNNYLQAIRDFSSSPPDIQQAA